MEYPKGYVYELMEQGGPTNVMEPYFMEAVDEMMRARTLCAKANACMPDDSTYVTYLEELFDRKLDDVRILTPFICDFGNRVKFGKNVFINHSAILSASGGIEFEDGAMSAPGLRIATINHDMYERHKSYKYALPVIILLFKFCYISGLFDRNVFKTVQSLNKQPDGIIIKRIPDKVDIHILSRSSGIIGYASHHDTAFYSCIAAQRTL